MRLPLGADGLVELSREISVGPLRDRQIRRRRVRCRDEPLYVLHGPQSLRHGLLETPPCAIDERLIRHTVGEAERASGAAVAGPEAGAGSSLFGLCRHRRQLSPGGGRSRLCFVPPAFEPG